MGVGQLGKVASVLAEISLFYQYAGRKQELFRGTHSCAVPWLDHAVHNLKDGAIVLDDIGVLCREASEVLGAGASRQELEQPLLTQCPLQTGNLVVKENSYKASW